MADKKTIMQKLYEKFLMVKEIRSGLRVMIAKGENGELGVFIACGCTPIAQLMSHSDLRKWKPEHEVGDMLNEAYLKAGELDDRDTVPKMDDDASEEVMAILEASREAMCDELGVSFNPDPPMENAGIPASLLDG